jgi:predicted nucleic acid-binding protein
MSTLLLDASTLLAAFDTEDRYHRDARKIIEDPETSVATLDLARYEAVNVAIRAWQNSNLVPTLLAVIDRVDDDGGVLRSTARLLQLAADLAVQHEISVYDATYAATAIDSGLRLISCDHRDLISKNLAEPPG